MLDLFNEWLTGRDGKFGLPWYQWYIAALLGGVLLAMLYAGITTKPYRGEILYLPDWYKVKAGVDVQVYEPRNRTEHPWIESDLPIPRVLGPGR
jgi:hypothetical protein